MIIHKIPLAALLSSACYFGGASLAFAQEQPPAFTNGGPASARVAEVKDQIHRIETLDDAGPMLNAVIAYNPGAADLAVSRVELPLEGKTVLVKDNIETAEWPTTAGSLALQNNMTRRDAPLIANLRVNGGIVLGKTNLSEWANIRDNSSTSGWSAIGGLTRNPHAIDRNSCGSSSGSGAAVAAGFAWAAIGTETNGSITCPASINGVVGFKPSVGLVSRTHVVPISSTQDTAGPMALTVMDAAMLLGAIAGEDSADAVTSTVPNRLTDYTSGLSAYSLEGVRIGVMRDQIGNRDDVETVFEIALADLERAGAVLVDVEFEPNTKMYGDSFTVLLFELREEMGKYLESIPEMEGEDPTPRSLADLIAFNEANAGTEMRYFGQSIFQTAEQSTDREAYEKARENAVRIAGKETLDMLLAKHAVQFLVAPTRGPSWTSDLVNGDNFNGSIGFGSPAAIAGYPHLTVPMGQVERLPIGISFFGAKWADHEVLKLGAAYERARSAQLPKPSFERWDADSAER
ncbi:amidase [Pontixanthobacter gangjinensis]|uniref:Amidase n=1 Tax=Pontixanthobacter gangjinensis TaxID=1028742 RepID=A0A6I4SKS2_9SPHN|nr:amidase [Pontixanthobacter gangjinensis]MXO56315.1 amidase [Pontixanthobacter gangjinensis]